jgi:methyl coenzyme M reductase gamma subunit
MSFNIVEQAKVVTGAAPATNGAAVTGDYVKLNAGQEMFAVVNYTGANAAQSTITINEAQSAAGLNAQAIASTVNIWSNLDVATTDTLVARADAVNYQTDAAVTNKLVVFRIDSRRLSDGFNWVNVVAGISDVANIVGITYIITGQRYAQATPPTAIA